MLDRFLHISEYAKTQMIEQIMALVGRGIRRARMYRDDLESMTLVELRREMELIENENNDEN